MIERPIYRKEKGIPSRAFGRPCLSQFWRIGRGISLCKSKNERTREKERGRETKGITPSSPSLSLSPCLLALLILIPYPPPPQPHPKQSHRNPTQPKPTGGGQNTATPAVPTAAKMSAETGGAQVPGPTPSAERPSATVALTPLRRCWRWRLFMAAVNQEGLSGRSGTISQRFVGLPLVSLRETSVIANNREAISVSFSGTNTSNCVHFCDRCLHFFIQHQRHLFHVLFTYCLTIFFFFLLCFPV